jgi:hypothetical protein
MVKTKPDLITNLPLTAEARQQAIMTMFDDFLPRLGELFLPDDLFYTAGARRQTANNMLQKLCTWLGIKPGYIGLVFESDGETHDGSRYSLYVEREILADEFRLGAFLAYGLTQFLLEERKRVHLPDKNTQAALMANASVAFGLGLVILNGLAPRYSWLQGRHIHQRHRLIKSFPVANYAQLVHSYTAQKHIPAQAYDFCLAPWAATSLGLHTPKRSTHMVRATRHRMHTNNLKLIGLGWLGVMFIMIATFAYVQRPHKFSVAAQAANMQANSVAAQLTTCLSDLSYQRQYTDPSDIHSERALAAKQTECSGLQNQLHTAQATSDQLSP